MPEDKTTIDDFVFDKYNPEQIEHIDRHMEGSGIVGSHFDNGYFKSAKEVVDFAYEQIKDKYQGKRLEVEVDLPQNVGKDSLVALKELPENATITQEARGRNEYICNIVSGVEMLPTKHMVIVAGPLGDSGKHGFYTIFPGKNAPPFPDNTEGTWQNEDQYKTFEKFWKDHALIKVE